MRQSRSRAAARHPARLARRFLTFPESHMPPARSSRLAVLEPDQLGQNDRLRRRLSWPPSQRSASFDEQFSTMQGAGGAHRHAGRAQIGITPSNEVLAVASTESPDSARM